MTALAIDVDSVELAKVLANALAFCPARSKFPAVLLYWADGVVFATASDTYTIGESWHDHGEPSGAPELRPVLSATLGLKDAQALEALARMDRQGTAATGQHGNGRLEFTPGDCLVFTPELKGEPLVLQDMRDHETVYGAYSALWAKCAELLDRLEDDAVLGPPEAALFDPNLLARFAKVKGVTETGDDAVMDMLFQEGDRPVLVKIGQNFRGAIMPVGRVANRTRQGSAGLWH